MNRSFKTVLFWLVILVSSLLLWQVVRSDSHQQRSPEISYSSFMAEVDDGNVQKVTITGARIQALCRDGKSLSVVGPTNPGVYMDALSHKQIEIWFKDTSTDSVPLQLLGSWAPLILVAASWFFMIRGMQTAKRPAGSGSVPPIDPR
jgi:cell division protease FtsH